MASTRTLLSFPSLPSSTSTSTSTSILSTLTITIFLTTFTYRYLLLPSYPSWDYFFTTLSTAWFTLSVYLWSIIFLLIHTRRILTFSTSSIRDLIAHWEFYLFLAMAVVVCHGTVEKVFRWMLFQHWPVVYRRILRGKWDVVFLPLRIVGVQWGVVLALWRGRGVKGQWVLVVLWVVLWVFIGEWWRVGGWRWGKRGYGHRYSVVAVGHRVFLLWIRWTPWFFLGAFVGFCVLEVVLDRPEVPGFEIESSSSSDEGEDEEVVVGMGSLQQQQQQQQQQRHPSVSSSSPPRDREGRNLYDEYEIEGVSESGSSVISNTQWRAKKLIRKPTDMNQSFRDSGSSESSSSSPSPSPSPPPKMTGKRAKMGKQIAQWAAKPPRSLPGSDMAASFYQTDEEEVEVKISNTEQKRNRQKAKDSFRQFLQNVPPPVTQTMGHTPLAPLFPMPSLPPLPPLPKWWGKGEGKKVKRRTKDGGEEYWDEGPEEDEEERKRREKEEEEEAARMRERKRREREIEEERKREERRKQREEEQERRRKAKEEDAQKLLEKKRKEKEEKRRQKAKEEETQRLLEKRRREKEEKRRRKANEEEERRRKAKEVEKEKEKKEEKKKSHHEHPKPDDPPKDVDDDQDPPPPPPPPDLLDPTPEPEEYRWSPPPPRPPPNPNPSSTRQNYDDDINTRKFTQEISMEGLFDSDDSEADEENTPEDGDGGKRKPKIRYLKMVKLYHEDDSDLDYDPEPSTEEESDSEYDSEWELHSIPPISDHSSDDDYEPPAPKETPKNTPTKKTSTTAGSPATTKATPPAAPPIPPPMPKIQVPVLRGQARKKKPNQTQAKPRKKKPGPEKEPSRASRAVKSAISGALRMMRPITLPPPPPSPPPPPPPPLILRGERFATPEDFEEEYWYRPPPPSLPLVRSSSRWQRLYLLGFLLCFCWFLAGDLNLFGGRRLNMPEELYPAARIEDPEEWHRYRWRDEIPGVSYDTGEVVRYT
ncbi:hypothetical protein BDD12DRAFT_980018 [Trichophaea hybrida]|nr:hypothetical protein BDD12DRAFT_980018 [Trichophaea hybrida]